MKSAICSFSLFLITAVAAHAHTSGLAHAHPHPESISAFAILSAGLTAGAIVWIAFRKINMGSRANQSR
jgi:hypothetical protein